MGWQIGNGPEQVGNFAPASQFRKSLYRPDVIKLALKTGSVATALERLNEPLKVVKVVLPPLVVITSPDHTGVRLDDPVLTVRATAVAESGHPVTALRLLLDGRPYNGDQGRKDVPGRPYNGDQGRKDVPSDAAGGRRKHASWQVRLDPAGTGWPSSPRAVSATASRTRSRSSTMSSAPPSPGSTLSWSASPTTRMNRSGSSMPPMTPNSSSES